MSDPGYKKKFFQASVRGNFISNGRGGSRRDLHKSEVLLRSVRLLKRYDGVSVTKVLYISMASLK